MTDYDKLEERRQMARSNYYAQLAMMGYDSSGNALDLVKITRCRNCANWAVDWKPIHASDDEHFCPVIDKVTGGDWYCADGELREREAEPWDR